MPKVLASLDPANRRRKLLELDKVLITDTRGSSISNLWIAAVRLADETLHVLANQSPTLSPDSMLVVSAMMP